MPPTHRRKPLRLVLLVAVGLIVAVAACLIVANAALNQNRLRDELQQAVLHATGRELSVAGPVHLSFGLSPRFEVSDIALANPPGLSRPQMLTAKSLSVELALLPLLGGDAVISSLTLQDPDIRLERGSDGVANWQLTPARRALYQDRTTEGTAHGGEIHRVRINRVTLKGGQIGWQGLPVPSMSFAIKSVLWTADSPDAPMRLSFVGVKDTTAISISASSGSLQRLQGGPVSALAGAWPISLDIATAGTGIHLEGGVNHPDQWRGYQFRVTANVPQLELLNPILPWGSLPPIRDLNATVVVADSTQGELRTSQLSAHAGTSDLGQWVPGLTVRQAVFSAPGPGQLAQLSVDGTYQEQPLRIAGSVMQPDVVGTGGPVQVTMTGQAAGASASARGTVPTRLNGAGLDLTVNLHAPDFSLLSPLAGRALPAARDLSLDAQITDAGLRLRGITVHDLVVASSLGDLAGQVTVQWDPRASVAGSLTSKLLNLDAIGAPAGGAMPAVWPMPPDADHAPLALAGGASDAPGLGSVSFGGELPLYRLRNTDADVSLAVGDLTIGGQHLQDLQAHLRLQDGKLALNPFRAQSPEGIFVGGASIDASSDQPPVAIALRSPAISAGAIAAVFGYPDSAHGTMQVDAQLSGKGRRVSEIRSTLDGHLGLAMVNGEVADSLVQSLIGAALDTAGVPSFSGGSSQVRCFATRVNFTNGVGTVRALAADTSKLVLDGTGQIDLAAQTVDLHLRPHLRLGPTELSAPVSLRGAFGDLRATLDPVLGGGRVGISIGGLPSGNSGCLSQLTLARGGVGGPVPAAAPVPDQGQTIRKPKDLLQGLFH